MYRYAHQVKARSTHPASDLSAFLLALQLLPSHRLDRSGTRKKLSRPATQTIGIAGTKRIRPADASSGVHRDMRCRFTGGALRSTLPGIVLLPTTPSSATRRGEANYLSLHLRQMLPMNAGGWARVIPRKSNCWPPFLGTNYLVPHST